TRRAPFSGAGGSSLRCSAVLKNSARGTAPASSASRISLCPSSSTFPWRSRKLRDFAMVTTFLGLLSPGDAFSYHSPGPAEPRSTAGGGGLRSTGLCRASASSFRDGSTRTGLRLSARTQRRPGAAPPGPNSARPGPATARLSAAIAAGVVIALRHAGRRGVIALRRSGGAMGARRALHFVFKVGDRGRTARFYRELLGMNVLRHEEFEEGCKASCNGPYDGRWSKTMVGYGPEDNHFVAELTYNYGIGEYRLGNDFLGITLVSSQAVSNAKKMGWPLKEVTAGVFETEAPGGYKFYLEDKEQKKQDPVLKVTLGVSDLHKSVNYWSHLLGMKIYEKDEEKQRALLGYADNQCKLELKAIGGAVDHGTAFGRIAFSCAKEELPNIEALMKKENQKILTPLVSLDTPGKATVQVIILADPDDHEICFVGDEAFRDLSKVDPNGDKLLDDAMAADESDTWFAARNMKKVSA
ncbi:GLOD4 protein, partial [Odontophorus gujanensis]|nr:GLOD4 protein [Odontophorus gujanensis]